MLYNPQDIYIGRSLDLYGEFSEGEIEVFQQIVRPDDVVVEVGANIGAHTIWLAKATSAGGAVMAFEPQRLAFQTLCANLALNSIMNTLAFQEAVGREAGSIVVPIFDPNIPGNFGGVGLGAYETGDEVPVVRLDEYDLPRCRLLKVDVEGMELDVLQGAREMIERCSPVLYVENDRPEKSAELVRYIAALGYELYWHKPPLFNPDNFAGNRENVFGNIQSINMLCTLPGSQVAELERVTIPAA
jgi:FkbM family methyltransferase